MSSITSKDFVTNFKRFRSYAYHLQNWCKLECCEEDVDWKVQEIPGKGLGIIALRDIPALTRIMVDRGYTEAEARNRPQVMDLHPKNESFETKFMANRVSPG